MLLTQCSCGRAAGERNVVEEGGAAAIDGGREDRSPDRLVVAVVMNGADCPVSARRRSGVDGFNPMAGCVSLKKTVGVAAAKVETISSVTKEMDSSLLAAAINDALRPHRIWDKLVVADMMGSLDYPMECPPLMGLPEMKTTADDTIGTVKTSSMLAGGYQRWKGWWLPSI
ncbi:hypothetical protein ACLOJK_039208 [Asimina triloba]